MPKLVKFIARNFAFSASSIRSHIGKLVTHLEFTPHLWKRSDMAIFSSFKHLEHLRVTGLALPSPKHFVPHLRHIKSLTLVSFNVEQCALLPYLTNLESLGLERPLFGPTDVAQITQYGPIGEMLYRMNWLKHFSLLGADHLTSGIKHALLHESSKLQSLELECCYPCINSFTEAFNHATHSLLQSVAFHHKVVVYWWHERLFPNWKCLSRQAFQHRALTH